MALVARSIHRRSSVEEERATHVSDACRYTTSISLPAHSKPTSLNQDHCRVFGVQAHGAAAEVDAARVLAALLFKVQQRAARVELKEALVPFP